MIPKLPGTHSSEGLDVNDARDLPSRPISERWTSYPERIMLVPGLWEGSGPTWSNPERMKGPSRGAE
jgi:hypothetical protein